MDEELTPRLPVIRGGRPSRYVGPATGPGRVCESGRGEDLLLRDLGIATSGPLLTAGDRAELDRRHAKRKAVRS